MSLEGETIYRVYLEGLSPKERTIFGGVLRLAAQGGTRFLLESTPEKSDLFILDGLDQRCLEFGKSHRQIAQGAIWIDPPAHLISSRQIRRPLHWGALLELMKRIISHPHEPVAEVTKPQTAELTLEQLCAIGEGILRLHLGIAAEFVMDDIRTELKGQGCADEAITADIFLATLGRQLPGNVDTNKVHSEVSAAISDAQHK